VSTFAEGILQLGGTLGRLSMALIALFAAVAAAVLIPAQHPPREGGCSRAFSPSSGLTRRLSAKIAAGGKFAGADGR
jgi:hypothetical protein